MHIENNIIYKSKTIYFDGSEFWLHEWTNVGLEMVVFDELHEIKDYINELTNDKLTNK